MILTLTLNPAVDLALGTDRFDFDRPVYVESETETAGGKGINAARLIHAWGGEVLAVAPVGGRQGERIRELLEAAKLPAELVPVQGATRRNVAISDVSGATLKVDHRGAALTESDLEQIEAAVSEHLPNMNWLMLMGSVAPGTPTDIYYRLVERARQSGTRVLVDSSGRALEQALDARPDLVKPNRLEASELLGCTIRTTDDAAAAARAIHDGGADRVVLSLGEQGAVGHSPSGTLLAAAPQASSGCPVGAGDVLAASCVWALDRGEPFEAALCLGVAAATASAALPGMQFATAGEADVLCRTVEARRC